MIVKFFKFGKGGSKPCIDYLLGKDRDREHARVLSGDVDLTADLIDSSRFTKNILLVVCRLPKRIFQKMPKEKSWLIMKNACFQAWQKINTTSPD